MDRVPTPFMDFLIAVLEGEEIADGLALYRDVMRSGLPDVVREPNAIEFLRETQKTWATFVMWTMAEPKASTDDMVAFFQMYMNDDAVIARRMAAARPGPESFWEIAAEAGFVPDSDDIGSSPFEVIVRQAFPQMFRRETRVVKNGVTVEDHVLRSAFDGENYAFVQTRYNWATERATGYKQVGKTAISRTRRKFDKGFFDSRKGREYLEDRREMSMPAMVPVGRDGRLARLPALPAGNIVQDVQPVHTNFPARFGFCGAEQEELEFKIAEYERVQAEALRLYKQLKALQVQQHRANDGKSPHARQKAGGMLCSSYDRRIAETGAMIEARRRDIASLKADIQRLQDERDAIKLGEVEFTMDDAEDDDFELPVRIPAGFRGGSGRRTLALSALALVTVAMAFVASA